MKNIYHRKLKARMQIYYLTERFNRTEITSVLLIIYLAHSSAILITEGMNITDLIWLYLFVGKTVAFSWKIWEAKLYLLLSCKSIRHVEKGLPGSWFS